MATFADLPKEIVDIIISLSLGEYLEIQKIERLQKRALELKLINVRICGVIKSIIKIIRPSISKLILKCQELEDLEKRINQEF